MTGAYAVFANNGVRNPPVGILKVEDKSGNILEEYRDDSKQVLDKNIALTISDVLSDNKARTPAFGANSPLYFPDRPVAAKPAPPTTTKTPGCSATRPAWLSARGSATTTTPRWKKWWLVSSLRRCGMNF